jgi:hypothetical protein
MSRRVITRSNTSFLGDKHITAQPILSSGSTHKSIHDHSSISSRILDDEEMQSDDEENNSIFSNSSANNGNIENGLPMQLASNKKRIRAPAASSFLQNSSALLDGKRIKVPHPTITNPQNCVDNLDCAEELSSRPLLTKKDHLDKSFSNNNSNNFNVSILTESLSIASNFSAYAPTQSLHQLLNLPQTLLRSSPQNSACFELFCSFSNVLESIEPDLIAVMLEGEKEYQPSAGYMSYQRQLDPSMRPILIDWMLEVAQEFTLGRETAHMAINYVDRFLTLNAGAIQLQGTTIDRTNLQLLGVTCLFIAAKLEEIYPPNALDFATTTDGAYSVQQIALLERQVLKVLSWRLHPQTVYSWLKLFIKMICLNLHAEMLVGIHSLEKRGEDPVAIKQQVGAGIEELRAQLNSLLNIDFFCRIMQLIDCALLDITFLRYYPSAIAAAALYSFHLNSPRLAKIIEECTGYSLQQLSVIVNLLSLFLTMNYNPHLYLTATKKPYFEELKIPREEIYSRQLHYTEQLSFLGGIKPQMVKLVNQGKSSQSQPSATATTTTNCKPVSEGNNNNLGAAASNNSKAVTTPTTPSSGSPSSILPCSILNRSLSSSNSPVRLVTPRWPATPLSSDSSSSALSQHIQRQAAAKKSQQQQSVAITPLNNSSSQQPRRSAAVEMSDNEEELSGSQDSNEEESHYSQSSGETSMADDSGH